MTSDDQFQKLKSLVLEFDIDKAESIIKEAIKAEGKI